MPTFLPLFPLQLVVFPNERLNLHIFEPRYKQLIQECEEKGITFGIPAYLNGKVMDLGTEIRLLKVEKRYDNGELDISTEGMAIFKVKTYYRTTPGKLYSAADVERLESQQTTGDYLLAEQLLEMIQELFALLNISKDLPTSAADFHTFDWAHHVGFTLEQEYKMLGFSSETERQQFMKTHLEQIIPRVREVEAIRQKAQMNGHFKNIIPPNV